MKKMGCHMPGLRGADKANDIERWIAKGLPYIPAERYAEPAPRNKFTKAESNRRYRKTRKQLHT